MIRRIRLEYEFDTGTAADGECGTCWMLVRDSFGPHCERFGRLQRGAVAQRSPQCLQAEAAAMPWRRDEADDDAVPHHLRSAE